MIITIFVLKFLHQEYFFSQHQQQVILFKLFQEIALKLDLVSLNIQENPSILLTFSHSTLHCIYNFHCYYLSQSWSSLAIVIATTTALISKMQILAEYYFIYLILYYYQYDYYCSLLNGQFFMNPKKYFFTRDLYL